MNKNKSESALKAPCFIFVLAVITAACIGRETKASSVTPPASSLIKNTELCNCDEIAAEAIALKALEEAPIEVEELAVAQPQTNTVSYNSSGLTPTSGVNYHNGWRETYYSSNVLYHYRTSEWVVGEDGVYRDSDGYVVVASSSDAQGSVVDTSFGQGKVYDTGCAEGTHDIYTNW